MVVTRINIRNWSVSTNGREIGGVRHFFHMPNYIVAICLLDISTNNLFHFETIASLKKIFKIEFLLPILLHISLHTF